MLKALKKWWTGHKQVISPEQGEAEAPLTARSKGKVTIAARVYRVATGEWEDLGVISTSEVDGAEKSS